MQASLTAADLAIVRRAQACLEQGALSDAQAVLMQVSAAAASHPDVLFIAGGILAGQGQFPQARRALEGALQQVPQNAPLWHAYASLLQDMGDPGAATDAWRRLLTFKPDDRAARHNLANALRQSQRGEEALAEVDSLIARGVALPETALLRGHLLADMGQLEAAVAQYRQVAGREPERVEAHQMLARLLPQTGQADAALDGFAIALAARPQDQALHDAAIVAARDLKDAARLMAWANEAQSRFGANPLYALAAAQGENMAGNRGAAISAMRQLAQNYPNLAGIRNHLAPLLLASGDYAEAEQHAQAATKLAPLDQSGWAWLSIAWRLMGDEREYWLADYEQLVMPITLPEVVFTPALAEALEALHVTSNHPAEQSLRGGTQTNGNLFDRSIPEIQALRRAIEAAITERLAAPTPDPSHPFLSRLQSGIAFQGSWSVRLRSSGFHINHIHHQGWLSSACYIALPPFEGEAGALAFGVPDSTLGLALSPRRIVRPREGQLVIFPSYFWHGTIPFESEIPRLTVAFDALPFGPNQR